MQQHTVNDSLNKEDRKCGMRLTAFICVVAVCAAICFKYTVFGIALCAAVLSASSYFYSQDAAYLSLKMMSYQRKTHYDPFKRRKANA
jgi:hypothetical protein